MADRGAPFRVSPLPGDPGIRRGDGGRFIPASPEDIQTKIQGPDDLFPTVHAEQAPHHPTPGGQKQVGEVPWGPAKPATSRHPFSVRGG